MKFVNGNVEGDPGDTVIPTGPPFPGSSGTAPFVEADDRVFEVDVPAWGWVRTGHEEGHTKELQNGKNTMRIYHRQGDNTVSWDTFVWTDSASYVPTDADYRNARLGDLAGNPNPPDGTIGVTMPLVSWTAGGSAVFHDVYFGTDPNPPLVSPRQVFPMYFHIPGLQPGMTYYWRVDEIEADGKTIHQGPVWKFMSEPLKDYAPVPADAAAGQLPGLVLSWTIGKDAVKHQVYFGTDVAAVTSGAASVDKGKISDAKFDTGALRASTTYFWRVDAVKADGSTVKGDVWSFSTADAGPANKIKAEVWLNIGAGTTVADLTSNVRYPSNPDTTQYLDSWLFPPGSTGGSDWANNYGDRLYGWLKPDQTGDYTFWIAGDDLSELWLSTDTSPTNTVRIAQVTGWTDALDWDGNTGSTTKAAQKSATIKLEAGKKYFIMTLHKEGGGGDSVGVAWQGPGIATRQLLSAKYVDVFGMPPLQAFGPNPANGAVDVAQSPALSWNAGDKAQKHDVYLGTDKAAVAVADNKSPLFQGNQTGATFNAADLAWGKTYYWRVDEINAAEADSPWKGPVWSFTTANFIPIDNMEGYTNVEGGRIFDTWIDGWTNKTGSVVGNTVEPFAEQTIIHGGKQAMPLDFNNAKAPFYSEAELDFAPLQNWTVNGVSALSLWVRGNPAKYIDKGNGAFTIGASGHDIWDAADDFRFVYKQLSGNGSIVVKVDSLVNTNAWAKAGVMIRETLDAGSKMAYAIVSFSSGVAFGQRVSQGAGAIDGAPTVTGIAAPQWVKLTRTGNAFTAQYSADGKTWLDFKNPALTGTVVSNTITMATNVYIGLCVTSHDATRTTTAELSGVATTGTVTGSWQQAWIGDDPDRTNGTAPLYVAVEDSTGKVAVASDPALVNAAAWTQWKIPLTNLTGVNLAKVKKLYLGVGDRKTPVADGAGRVYLDDIQVIK